MNKIILLTILAPLIVFGDECSPFVNQDTVI